MAEHKKERVFTSIIKNGLNYISQILSPKIFHQISEGIEIVMDNIEDKIILIETRFVRRVFSLLTIGLGALFLVFALLFYLKEYLNWSNTAAFFSVGITIFVIGLILKLGEYRR